MWTTVTTSFQCNDGGSQKITASAVTANSLNGSGFIIDKGFTNGRMENHHDSESDMLGLVGFPFLPGWLNDYPMNLEVWDLYHFLSESCLPFHL